MLAAAALVAGACASIQGPPEDVPPEAPSANTFRFLTPTRRDVVLPPPQLFGARDWLERLVCDSGEQPGWKRTNKAGLVEAYDLECPPDAAVSATLDTARPEPTPPGTLRLLEPKSYAFFKEAQAAGERHDFDSALVALDAALELAPTEVVYRRERVYVLYSLGRSPEALLAADALTSEKPSPIVYKYRALAAKDLGLRGEVMKSIEGIMSSADRRHPLFAEAVCAKGMMLATDGDETADTYMREGCALDHKQCCEVLHAREAARREARRALEAARSRPMSLPIKAPIQDVPQVPSNEQLSPSNDQQSVQQPSQGPQSASIPTSDEKPDQAP